MNTITANEVRSYFEQVSHDDLEAFVADGLGDIVAGDARTVRDSVIAMSDNSIETLLDHGLRDLIEELEANDYFGTEGFDKRFS